METNIEDTEICWIVDFTINEPLHGTAPALSGVYTRLSINFPENPQVQFWDEQAIEWHRYYNRINNFHFKTHEDGEVEIKRISKICKEMLGLEQDLLKKSGQID